MRRTALLLLAGATLVGGVIFLGLSRGVSTTAEDAVDEQGSAQHELVRVHAPGPDEAIESPLRVEGEARGSWFFEASFPVTLLSEDGSEVARHYVMATGEWMTEEFVPFSTEILFSHPGAGRGWLVLERANPSGLPENDDELRIPIRFRDIETVEIEVYFNRRGIAECEETVGVTRQIPRTRDPVRAALEHLLAGPGAAESERGYLTSIPAGVTIQRLSLRNGRLKADLSRQLEAGVAGSCRVMAIRSQLERTLGNLPDVNSVLISIDGRVDDILQP